MQVWCRPAARLLLALSTVGLAACGSTTPTAPSPPAASAGPQAGTASESPDSSTVVGGAPLVAARTIKIKQGTLSLRSLLPGTVELRGSHGFRFDGRVQSGLEPSAYCGPFNPCQPGTSVPFTATWVGLDIPGTVRVLGDEFVTSLEDGTGLYLVLTGAFVAPAHLTDTVSVIVPFTASGQLSRRYPDPQLVLTGGGDVTFSLEWQTSIGGWAIQLSSFDFDGGFPD